MSHKEISIAAVERNNVWIEAITNVLKNRGNPEFPQVFMREVGTQCAAQLREKIIAHFGRTPQSVDGLIEAIS